MAILGTLGDMAKNIGSKASGAVEITKLNSKISSEKNLIEGVYRKIGEYYYGKYQSGKKAPEETAAWLSEIDGHNAVINEAMAEIERINAAAAAPAADVAICQSCGKKNKAGMKFCQECGSKLEAAAAEKPEAAGSKKAAKACECGAEIVPGKKFCTECGKPISSE
jgi:hypothetical protein